MARKREGDDLGKVMASIDPVSTLLRLGITNPKTGDRITANDIKRSGDELITYCPDHSHHVHRMPSDPKWSLNVKTGACYCFTEGRGSTLALTVMTVKDISYQEAMEWLRGEKEIEGDSLLDDCKYLISKSLASNESEEKTQGEYEVRMMRPVLEKGWISQSGLRFFMYPPGKKPTLINEETVRKFGVAECGYGKYHDRVVIPCNLHGKLEAFVAIDKLGKEEWEHKNPGKKYKKVLYPPVKIGGLLFNYDNVQKNCDELIITEGPREAMRLTQEGFPNSVSLLGGNLTEAHMGFIEEINPKSVTAFMDGDDAGREFSIKIAGRLDDVCQAKIALTPEGFDPKSLPSEKIKEVLAAAIDYKKI